MSRFLGNTTFTLAKEVCRKGMLPLQYRGFSSASVKAVPKIYGHFFKAAFGGAGFLLGSVTTSPFPSGLLEIEEEIKELSSDDTHVRLE